MTYFIEQYAMTYSKTVSNTMALPISFLEGHLAKTAQLENLKTVAIFKIKEKKVAELK